MGVVFAVGAVKGENMSVDYNKIKERLKTILKANQTDLVRWLMLTIPALRDEIENRYPQYEPLFEERICIGCFRIKGEVDRNSSLCKNCFESEKEQKSVYQWYAVDDNWGRIFRDRGLVILRTMGCCWFGRTWVGDEVEKDDDFNFLANEEVGND